MIFMLPIIIGAAAGLFVGKKMGEKMGEDLIRTEKYAKAANEIYAKTSEILNTTNASLHEAQNKMVETLRILGERKKYLMLGSISEMAQLMIKLGKKLKLNHDTQGFKELESAGFNTPMFEEVEKSSAKLIALSNPQETDVADSLLSVTIGAIGVTGILGGLIAFPLSPLVMLYTSSKADEAEAEFYKAQQKFDEAKVYFEHCGNQSALLRAITLRAKQIDKLLKGLDFYFSRSVNRVQEIILENGYEYRNYSKEDKNQIFIALQLMQTVKAIIDTSMFFEDGSFKGNDDLQLETGEKVLKLLNSI